MVYLILMRVDGALLLGLSTWIDKGVVILKLVIIHKQDRAFRAEDAVNRAIQGYWGYAIGIIRQTESSVCLIRD